MTKKTQKSAAASGLEGVVAAETVLSQVNGAEGRLIIAGLDLADLVDTYDFEGVLARLWTLAGTPCDRGDVKAALGAARVEAFAAATSLAGRCAGRPIVEGLREGLAALSDEGDLPAHIRLTGAAPVLVASLARTAAGTEPVAPDPTLGHAEDYLRMLHGKAPTDAAIRAMDTYLMTVSDHGMNASTFTARVIASTDAKQVSAIVGGLCALKGPLHGGAPGPVLDMLDAIGTKANAVAWVQGALDRGERLMGFGHRIYRVRDPRADMLGREVTRLGDAVNERAAFALHVEETAKTLLKAHKPDRPLDTNVEFYTALLLEALDIPRDAFTPTFAIGRVAGWTAHVMEQERTGRLIRPSASYIGVVPDGRDAA